MNNFQATGSPLSGWDNKVLCFWRDTATITLFVVAPILQIALTRWLPLAVFLALLFVLLGHILTRFRHLSSSFPNRVLDVACWSTGEKLLAFSYIGFLSWMALSLSWSPLPAKAARDLLLLTAAPPISLFLAFECSRTKLFPFSYVLAFGMTVTAFLLALEAGSYTQFHKLGSVKMRFMT